LQLALDGELTDIPELHAGRGIRSTAAQSIMQAVRFHDAAASDTDVRFPRPQPGTAFAARNSKLEEFALSTPLQSRRFSAAPRTDEGREPQSIVTLLRRLARQLSTLLRNELALASAELIRAARTTVAGATVAVAGGVILFAGFLVLLSSAVLGLSLAVAPWLAALIVGAAVSIVGGVALAVGIRRLRPDSLHLPRTSRSLSKDKAAILRRVK